TGYQWRPTGRKLTLGKLDCGSQWRPTGKKFALGEICQLTKLSVKCRTGHALVSGLRLVTFCIFRLLRHKLWMGAVTEIIDPTISEDSRVRCCMDKAKITRKPSKTGKHGHENGRAQKKPGNQAKGQISHIKAPHWSSQAIKLRGRGKAQKEAEICIDFTHTTSTRASHRLPRSANPSVGSKEDLEGSEKGYN
ncbi:hypothetical protein Tco_0242674, partial [Tanacetum coccineum]